MSVSNPDSSQVANLRPWLAPGAVALALVAILVTVVVLAVRANDSGLPPRADQFTPPAPGAPTVAYDVERVEGDRLTVAAGKDVNRERLEITLPAGMPVDILEPADPDAFQVGDWVTVVGVTNVVRNFALKSVLVFPGPVDSTAKWATTPSGFLGHEAARETRENVILAGPVVEVGDHEITIDVGGPVTIDLADDAPVRRLRTGGPGDIREGDRIALHRGPDGQGDLSRGALLLVGGAR